MPEYVRVKDKETGHEFTVPARRFDADLFTKVDRPAVGSDGYPLPAKHKTTVASAAAKKTATKSADTPKEK